MDISSSSSFFSVGEVKRRRPILIAQALAALLKWNHCLLLHGRWWKRLVHYDNKNGKNARIIMLSSQISRSYEQLCERSL